MTTPSCLVKSLAALVAEAAAGEELVLAPGDYPLDTTLLLDRPLTLRGPGARLLGHARDALVRIRAAVTIEGLEIVRPPSPVSWGSCVVVEPGGALTLLDCRVVGAAHGWVVERGATLAPGEAWSHGGVDVRGTGHARLVGCTVADCAGDGVCASVFPRDAAPNLVVEGGRIERAGTGVRALAQAWVSLKDVVIDHCMDVGVACLDGGLLNGGGVRVEAPGRAGLEVLGGAADLSRLTVLSAPIGVNADRQTRVTLRDTTLDGCKSAFVAAGRAQVEVVRGRVRGAANALEAVGAAELRASKVQFTDVGAVAILAADAGSVRADGCSFGGAPEWGVYAELAASVEVIGALPPGRVDLRGAARLAGEASEGVARRDPAPIPWDLASWLTALADRSDRFDAPTRAVIAERLRARLADGSWLEAEGQRVLRGAVFAWGALGRAGLGGARVLFGGEGWPDLAAPVAILRPIARHDVGRGKPVVALAALQDGCFVALQGGAVLRLDPDGAVMWRERGHTPVADLIAVGDYLIVVAVDRDMTWIEERDPTTGRSRGKACLSGQLAAIRCGSPHALVGWDVSGHPTDRCTWRAGWVPGEQPGAPEAMAQGAVSPDGEWDWLQGRQPWRDQMPKSDALAWLLAQAVREDRAVAGNGEYVVVPDAGSLRLYDAAAVCVTLFEEPGVTALSWGADLWVGGASGTVVRCRLEAVQV